MSGELLIPFMWEKDQEAALCSIFHGSEPFSSTVVFLIQVSDNNGPGFPFVHISDGIFYSCLFL